MGRGLTKMIKALVTGYLGFIGSNLYKKLLNNPNYNVHGLDKHDLSKQNWINDIVTILSTFEPNVIFHIGACTNTLETDVNYMMKSNFESTKIISDWCRVYDVPLIYSSSAANYGVNGLHPSNLYGWSKYVSEKYVISNGGVALRYFNVYGPGESHKDKMASVAYQMYVKQKKREDVKLFPLKPKRDFIYVSDVVDANIFAYENYIDCSYKYFDVGVGYSTTFEEVLSTMGIDFEYYKDNEINIPDGYQFLTCSDKNKWLVGWVPKYDINEGILEYKKYLDENNSNR